MTPTESLELVLDPEHAQAVVDHRKALKKPLTAFAARLLAREFAKCDDPNSAAEAMIIAGWQGFKPEWVQTTKPSKTSELRNDLRNRITASQGSEDTGHVRRLAQRDTLF